MLTKTINDAGKMSAGFASASDNGRPDCWARRYKTLRGYGARALAACRIRLSASHLERKMELVETLNLGGKRQLMLVQCDGQRYLVGLGSDSVQSIVLAVTESCTRMDLQQPASGQPA